MATALKSGMVGHVYRAARDGGLLAIATGVWMFASTIYPALTGERATATVTSIDTGCAYAAELSVIQSMSGLAPDCSFTALAETGLVHEAKMVKLSFTSRIGAPYSAEVPFDSLNRPNLQAGDSVPVSSSRKPAIAGQLRTRSAPFLE